MEKKALVSAGTGVAADWISLTKETFAAYATRHGYDLHLESERVDPTRPASWDKVQLIRALLDDYEIVLWVDADAVFISLEEDIADHLPDWAFLALRENDAGRGVVPNAGVMVFRASDEAKRFLDETWALDHYRDHPWWENAAMLELWGFKHTLGPNGKVDWCEIAEATDYYRHTAKLDIRFNSMFFMAVDEPSLRHLAGVYPRSVRARLMQMDVDLFRSRYHPDGTPKVEPGSEAWPKSFNWQHAYRLAQATATPIAAAGLSLRPATSGDLELLTGWLRDPDNYRYWHQRPIPREEVAAKYVGQDPYRHPFVIEEGGRAIGYAQCFLRRDEDRVGCALLLIPEARGQGLGSRAGELLLERLFGYSLPVAVTPLPANERAWRAWEKAGLVRQRRETPAGPVTRLVPAP